MNAQRAAVVLGILMTSIPGVLPAAAQGLPAVRIVAEEAKVLERPELLSGTVSVVSTGTILELIDKQDDWYWVLLARDENGTRPAGWVQASRVEVAAPGNSRASLRTLHEELEALPTTIEPSRKQRKEERDKARQAARDARAAARLEEAAKRVEEARRQYEDATRK